MVWRPSAAQRHSRHARPAGGDALLKTSNGSLPHKRTETNSFDGGSDVQPTADRTSRCCSSGGGGVGFRRVARGSDK
eukprot:scaffold772_cov236-Pinguiococcus_pyrenoidosus.AAC.2